MAKTQTFTAACSQVGSFSYAKYFTLYVVLTDRDGKSDTNKSQVDYNVYCQSSGSGSIKANHTLYFNLNGKVIRNENIYVNVSSPNAYIGIASGTLEVEHENDGKKKISFAASITASGGYGVSASTNGNFDLEDIPRYANLTSLTVKSRTINSITLSYTTDRAAWLFVNLNNSQGWLNNGEPFVSNTTRGEFTIYYKDRASTARLDPNTKYTITVLCRALDRNSGIDTQKNIEVTTYDIAKIQDAPNVYIGNSHTITWTNDSGAAISLRLCKTDNNTVIDYGEVTGTSKTVTPTANTIYALTPNSNEITLRYFIITTVNNQSYTNYKDCIFYVTNSNPTFAGFTYQDINTNIVNNLTGNNQTIIKGYSMVQATVSTANKAVAKNYATMSKYRLSIGEKTNDVAYSNTANVSMRIDYVNSNIFTVYAIDSRQNSTPKQITASNYISYEPIVIKQIEAIRTNSVTSETTLKFSGSMWAGNFGLKSNSITKCYYRYKKTTDSTWTTGTTNLTPVISGSNFSLSVIIVGDLGATGFDIDNSYNIQVFIEDRLSNNNSNPASFILGPGTPGLAIYKNNVAIGQKYDTSDGSKLQVNGDVKANTFKGNLSGNATSANYASNYRGYTTNINNATSTGWYRYNSEATNKPNYISEWGIVVVQNDGNWIFQTAYSTYTTDSRIAHRGCINGSWTDWTHVMPGALKTLYDNSSGTTGTITLSETSANFSYLEIFFSRNTNNGYDYTKIYSPNGKKANLNLLEPGSKGIVLYSALVTVSGTSITFNSGFGLSIFSGSDSHVYTDGSATANEIKIYRVIGYR